MDEKLKEKGKVLFGVLKKILDKVEQEFGSRQALNDWGTSIHSVGEKQIIVEIPDQASNDSEIYTCCEDGTVFGTQENEGGPVDEANPEEGNEVVLEPIEITDSSLDQLIKIFTTAFEEDEFI